jgi:hypothetical protein
MTLDRSAKALTGPFLAPAVARRDAAVREAVGVNIGNRAQIRSGRATKHLKTLCRSATAGRVVECFDRGAIVGQHPPPRLAYRRVTLRRFRAHATIGLVGYGRVQVEPLRAPATQVTERIGPGNHGLCPQCRLLRGVTPPHLRGNHAQQVRLETEAVDHSQSGPVAEDLYLTPIRFAVHPHRRSRMGRRKRHGFERSRNPPTRPAETKPATINPYPPGATRWDRDDAGAIRLGHEHWSHPA